MLGFVNAIAGHLKRFTRGLEVVELNLGDTSQVDGVSIGAVVDQVFVDHLFGGLGLPAVKIGGRKVLFGIGRCIGLIADLFKESRTLGDLAIVQQPHRFGIGLGYVAVRDQIERRQCRIDFTGGRLKHSVREFEFAADLVRCIGKLNSNRSRRIVVCLGCEPDA